MIIRILGQGQYEVASSLFDTLNAIDNKIVECVQNGNVKEYNKNFAELTDLILKEGKKIPDTELVGSSVMVPPTDLTFEEARQIFRGDGIFKG
ncbi:MAG: hypothetical protein GXY48_00165 [Methanomicrobiales archaeon]|nr:hypothetical protein [Methanomicrobiales archaeon]